MLQTVLTQLSDIAADMSTREWVILGGVALLLTLAIVQQLAKTALFAIVLVVAGFFVLHGRTEHWFL